MWSGCPVLPWPTFPAPPLDFRMAGFSRYGFKASTSDRAFLRNTTVKPAPGVPASLPQFPSTLSTLPQISWTQYPSCVVDPVRDKKRRYNPVGANPNMVKAKAIKLGRRVAGESRARCLLTNPEKVRGATLWAICNERRASPVITNSRCRASEALAQGSTSSGKLAETASGPGGVLATSGRIPGVLAPERPLVRFTRSGLPSYA